jgi:2-oxoglutarate dehydrogenase E1 component
LGELIDYLDKIYCGKIGYEYFHLTNWEERSWIRDRIENFDEFKSTPEQ